MASAVQLRYFILHESSTIYTFTFSKAETVTMATSKQGIDSNVKKVYSPITAIDGVDDRLVDCRMGDDGAFVHQMMMTIY